MDGEQEHLNKLKRQLYGPLEQLRQLRRTDLETQAGPRPSLWKRVEPLQTANQVLSLKLLKKLLWITGLLFFMALGAAALVFWRGNNSVSTGNVDIKVSGANESAAGEEVQLQVAVTNNNQTSLELADLIVEYPKGTRVAGALATPLTRERISLGNLKQDETIQKQLRAVFFGEQGSDQEVKLSVEYRLADSSAIFRKESSYHVFINSTPLTVLVDAPEEANSSQEITIKATVESNAEGTIERPVVVANYPAGFRFLRATPEPSSSQRVWQFPDLKPGKKIAIEIHGTLEGQDDEEKAFRISAGTVDREGSNELTATYGSTLAPVTIRRPVVALNTEIEGQGGAEVVADSRDPLRVDMSWINNAPEPIIDAEVLVKLTGAALDKTDVDTDRGYYNSSAGTVLWTKQSAKDLAEIDPGEGGRLSFSFSTLSLVSDEGASLRQPELGVVVELRGKRVTDAGKTENVFISTTQKVRLNSVTQFAAKVLHHTGPFENRGPVPPKVGEETTYTVVWSVLNSSNNLNGAKITASLPSYVKWLGFQSPLSEPLDFRGNESGGGELVWNLGQVVAGSGTNNAAREVSFMVSITPSLGQVGDSPVLVLNPSFEGVDSFTRQVLTAKPSRNLNTEFSTESQFRLGDGRVEN
jgi:hypothetical protein